MIRSNGKACDWTTYCQQPCPF